MAELHPADIDPISDFEGDQGIRLMEPSTDDAFRDETMCFMQHNE